MSNVIIYFVDMILIVQENILQRLFSYCDTNQMIFIFVYDVSLYTYLCFLQHRKTRKETNVKLSEIFHLTENMSLPTWRHRPRFDTHLGDKFVQSN